MERRKLNRLRKNKKGSLQDILFGMVIFVVFAVTTLIAFKINSEINDRVQIDSAFDSNARAASTAMNSKFSGTLDNMFLFLVVGFSLGAIVLAALVRVHPMFAVFFLIALIFLIFISGVMSNIYENLASDANFTAQADQLIFISLIMRRLPIFIAVFGIIMMAVLHKLNDFT